ncbi:single-stranded-DNA-specific exonuclease RecJ [Pelosinus fermentans]|uniref:Single-stranded-DNA-specific exonuclease RecJ n=1 Tax=Pelosinus fermentans JBW45 TaxID=1192197 RepID=I9NXW2_9FIRM|nr:single-stranded-DNA-specific exonuclease RecJ [Pelosinus fermentans]AJQ27825.1 single-stranded-DNA-specific exonuclease RecJ [Pelosinus fermentans JBW45]
MPKVKPLWQVMPKNKNLRQELSNTLGISDIIAQVLINRGIVDTDTANDFLSGGIEKLADPYLLKGMEKAVARIAEAITHKQKIIVYGDYDVDGITSSALLYKVIKELGGAIEYYIPERQSEGYGLNSTALATLIHSGTNLLITVDCGISAVEEVNAIAHQMDIIITDHHQPPEVLPLAYAIINPKQKDCPYPEKNLAGVGVAFKLAQALSRYYYGHDDKFLKYLDIVAIGTVADIVPLTSENRILVKLGLGEIVHTENIGLKELIEVCRVDPDKIDAGKIGFAIAPRLNAAGRISRADYGVELLITDNTERARELATYLECENIQRQTVEKDIQAAAEGVVNELDLNMASVLVVVGEDWHPGVIGIVASRLVEKYFRPVFMISIRDGIGKASCRSIPAFDIYDALNQCSDILLQFGGHRQAAGFSVLPEKIEELKTRLNHIADTKLTPADYIPVLTIDSLLSLNEINKGFLEQLGCLEPYGMGNRSPVFACEDIEVEQVRTLGQEARHLKLKVKQKNITNDVVAWQMGELAEKIQIKEKIEMAFFPEINEWQGQQKIQLRAYDIRKKEITEVERLYSLYGQRDQQFGCLEDCYADESIISLGNDLGEQITWVLKDSRNIDDKITYLLNLIKTQEKILIFVNTPQAAFELAQGIRKSLSKYKERIGFYHSRLDETWRNKVEAWFKEDQFTVLCTTLLGKKYIAINDIRHIVVYDVPLNMQSLIQQCNLVGRNKANDIHLLFNQKDLKDNLSLLQELRPERIVIGQIYLVLKKYAETFVTDLQVVELVRSKYQTIICESSVAIAIKIFEDLKLVTHELSGNKRKIVVLPAPKEKLEIEQSKTFREGILLKDEFAKFAEKIMNVSSTALLQEMKGNHV